MNRSNFIVRTCTTMRYFCHSIFQGKKLPGYYLICSSLKTYFSNKQNKIPLSLIFTASFSASILCCGFLFLARWWQEFWTWKRPPLRSGCVGNIFESHQRRWFWLSHTHTHIRHRWKSIKKCLGRKSNKPSLSNFRSQRGENSQLFLLQLVAFWACEYLFSSSIAIFSPIDEKNVRLNFKLFNQHLLVKKYNHWGEVHENLAL